MHELKYAFQLFTCHFVPLFTVFSSIHLFYNADGRNLRQVRHKESESVSYKAFPTFVRATAGLEVPQNLIPESSTWRCSIFFNTGKNLSNSKSEQYLQFRSPIKCNGSALDSRIMLVTDLNF